jgi:Ni,Fe-hydrogenase maturation factor
MNKDITIYVCGNPLLEFDSLPLRLKSELEKKFTNIEFKELDPTENVKAVNKELVLIDTVMDLDEVKTITDIESIQGSPNFSVHDFDLGFQLKLMKRLGQLEKVTIFGVPAEIDEQRALKQLIQKLKAHLDY